MNPDEFDDFLGALRGIPRLPGAECVGRSDLFDPRAEHEPEGDWKYRRNTALSLCRQCTALASCGQWFESLKPSKRPPGIVAGIDTAKPAGPKASA